MDSRALGEVSPRDAFVPVHPWVEAGVDTHALAWRRPPPAGSLAAIAQAVDEAAPGTVFTPARFEACGDRSAVNKTLQILVAQERLRRLARGVYDKPRRDAGHGLPWPTLDDVVDALTVGEGLSLVPTGAYAALLMDHADTAPDQVEFLAGCPSRAFDAGPLRVRIQRTPDRHLAKARGVYGLLRAGLEHPAGGHAVPRRLTVWLPPSQRVD